MADKTAFDYVNEIWSIANYVRDVIRPADYNKLILPIAVLRRFECALEPTRAGVIGKKVCPEPNRNPCDKGRLHAGHSIAQQCPSAPPLHLFR